MNKIYNNRYTNKVRKRMSPRECGTRLFTPSNNHTCINQTTRKPAVKNRRTELQKSGECDCWLPQCDVMCLGPADGSDPGMVG